MADFAAKKNAYVSRLVNRTVALIEALDELDGLRKEWDEVGFGADGEEAITDEDLVGNFPALETLDLSNMMNTIDAYDTLRTQGHGSNMQALRP